jgi:hypothetical protein
MIINSYQNKSDVGHAVNALTVLLNDYIYNFDCQNRLAQNLGQVKSSPIQSLCFTT